MRTALALVAGGVAAAKALDFHHEAVRWVVSAPPVLGAAVVAGEAPRRWQRYEDAMRRGAPLPVGQGVRLLALGVSAYALLALVAVALDG